MTTPHEATYSAEDNKLRIYPAYRLEKEVYDRLKENGFRWAPRQELFVAPKWTTKREDLCLELCGDIFPEQTTLAERAEIRAGRFEGYAERRAADASAFSKAARDLSARFEGGQPILVGHHSERRARKDADRADKAMRKSVKAIKTADYWNYRSAGVISHANRKNRSDVRARRIKTLLKELRDYQRKINDAERETRNWNKINSEKLALYFLQNGGSIFWRIEGETWEEKKAACLAKCEQIINSRTYARVIMHILNRLAYERELLGPVIRYEGELTPVILQGFARTMGTEKPKARKTDFGFILECPGNLPFYIGEGSELELDEDGWRDLMVDIGYEVPKAKPKKPPILNLPVDIELKSRNRYHRDEFINYPRVAMTKAEYKGNNGHLRPSICGQFQFKVCVNPFGEGPRYQRNWCAPFLTDSKAHNPPAPQLDAAE